MVSATPDGWLGLVVFLLDAHAFCCYLAETCSDGRLKACLAYLATPLTPGLVALWLKRTPRGSDLHPRHFGRKSTRFPSKVPWIPITNRP